MAGFYRKLSFLLIEFYLDPTLYVLQEQHLPTTLPIGLVVRTRGDVSAAGPQIRAAMASLDKTQVVDRFQPMTSYLDASLSTERFRTALVSVFGITGLLLVLVGLAGLTARMVAERTMEIGVRMALGAAPSRLWFSTTFDALKGVGAGLAAGIVTAALTFRLLSTLLTGVLPPSGLVWGADIAFVAALCTLAAGLPAHRVIHVRPSEALRAS